MRIVARLILLFLIIGVSALAQASPTPENTHQIHPGAMNTICGTRLQPGDGNHAKGSTESTCVTVFVPGCPIDMRVRQGVGGGMLAANENGAKGFVFSPRLSLFLNDTRPGWSGQKIVSATVTVRGTNGKERIEHLNQNLSLDRDSKTGPVQRTLSVDLASWGEPGTSGDFRLPGFTSASRVDLESVTYDDGSTWKLSGTEICHVAPDLLMKVSY